MKDCSDEYSKNPPSQATINSSAYVELNILEITEKNFSGDTYNIKKDELIKVSNDDFEELDIIVSPFNT